MTQTLTGKIEFSKQNILENVQMKLVNATECEEKYKDVPAVAMMDLKVVFQVEIKDIEKTAQIPGGYEATALVSETLLEVYDIDMDELFTAAQKNTFEKNEYKMETMDQVLARMMGETAPQMPKDVPQLYAITNDKSHNGANVLMNPGLLQTFLRTTGKDRVYILPSSIHEVLLYDDPNADAQDLRNMVTEINRTQVIPEERLSDNVYVLDEKGLRVA